MRTEPKGRTKIWVILALAAVLWTAGSAALDAAGSDETY